MKPSASGELSAEEVECAGTRESSGVGIEVSSAVPRECVTTTRVTEDLEPWIRREGCGDISLLFLRHELVVLGEVHLQWPVHISCFVEKLPGTRTMKGNSRIDACARRSDKSKQATKAEPHHTHSIRISFERARSGYGRFDVAYAGVDVVGRV